MTAGTHLAVRVGAALFAATGLAAWALRPATADFGAAGPAQPPAPVAASYALAAPAAPAGLADLFAAAPASLSAGTPADGAERSADLPDVVGLAGRLPDDVEVLVRASGGGTTALRIGQAAAGGWRLVSVAPDRAVFERAGEQRAVVLGPGG